MSDDYLWDGSGEPDPEVERLERVLGSLRSRGTAPPRTPRVHPGRSGRWLVAAALLIIAGGVWWARPGPAAGWEVAPLEGATRLGPAPLGERARLPIGDWLVTGPGSRARLRSSRVGDIEVGPDTRLRLLRSTASEQRLDLRHGSLEASISAPPRLFLVETPAALAVDLGCSYRLEVDGQGNTLLTVRSGWVALEVAGMEAVVPAGARCATRPGASPGTPYFADASERFRTALERLAESTDAADRDAALATLLDESRRRDALTLWHLLSRHSGGERMRLYDRLAALVPPPSGVSRDAVLQGNRAALAAWWQELGFGGSYPRRVAVD